MSNDDVDQVDPSYYLDQLRTSCERHPMSELLVFNLLVPYAVDSTCGQIRISFNTKVNAHQRQTLSTET